ncbi:MAG: hypothetical protein FK730_14560 [Asgard group archaeon]|nr:hypothetical protein [Asgard group archaeon]
MVSKINELEINYIQNYRRIEQNVKELPSIKKLNVFQFILPIFLLVILSLIFSLDLITNGFTVKGLFLHLILPISIYFIIIAIGALFINKHKNKIRKHSDNNPREIKVIISNEGINVNAIISDSILEWRYIKQVIETENLVSFQFLSKLLSFSIPKIALGREKMIILKQILSNQLAETKIKQIKRKNRLEKIEEGM